MFYRTQCLICWTVRAELLLGNRVFDLVYTDVIVLLSDNSCDRCTHLWHNFAPSYCKVSVQDWPVAESIFPRYGDQPEVINISSYLERLIKSDGDTGKAIISRMAIFSEPPTAVAPPSHRTFQRGSRLPPSVVFYFVRLRWECSATCPCPTTDASEALFGSDGSTRLTATKCIVVY